MRSVRCGAGCLIVIGLLRIVSTYHVFNHTIDEGAHLACGIQWFQGVLHLRPKHTPIARISIALLPYLDGVRGFGNHSFWEEGSLVLSTGGRYWHNLTLARIGVLPYFVLAIVVIFCVDKATVRRRHCADRRRHFQHAAGGAGPFRACHD